MFTRFEITGFRGHQQLKLDGLARVNLLVGANNSGKTAVLDAVELLVRDGHPQALLELANRRGGISGGNGQQLPPTVRHLFFGHAIGGKASFTLHSEGDPERTLRVEFADNFDDTQVKETGLVSVHRDTLAPHEMGAGNYSTGPGSMNPKARAGKYAFVGPGPTDEPTLHSLWSSIVGNPDEDVVIEALKIVDPLIERVVFAPDGNGAGKGPIYVRRSSERERIPLSTMGEGLRRVLALAIRLVSVTGGTLLVDEIDDGLHFRAMVGLWTFLIREAERRNVQIFATTHSADCVEAIGWIHRLTPEVVGNVCVMRISPTRTVATRYEPAELDIALEGSIEVRG